MKKSSKLNKKKKNSGGCENVNVNSEHYDCVTMNTLTKILNLIWNLFVKLKVKAYLYAKYIDGMN